LSWLETRTLCPRPSASAPPIRLHPNLAQVYRRKVEQLQQALNDPEIRDEAIEVLRSLLESVVIAPADGGLEIEIVGEIAHMIEIGMEDGKRKGPVLNESTGRSVKVVAGVGFEPTTFRL
jgi:site-specific DNA recombinase